jgi:hypothetical protein
MGPGSSWRRNGVVGLVAVGALVCGVAAGEAVDGGSDGPGAPPPGPPVGSPLAGVPWLLPDGTPTIDEADPRGSVRFPAGVGYREALEAVLLAALGGGGVPAGAAIAPPLPPGVVLVRPAGAGEGLRLSLTAPWGYDREGRIRAPSVAVPDGWPPGRVREAMAELHGIPPRVADGLRVDAPRLAPCQVAQATPDNHPPCSERP